MNKHTREIMHSSARDDWGTPQALFDQLNEIYHFTLDPASNDLNTKCEKHFTQEQDGLKQSWAGEVVFLNSPYGEPEQPCKKNKKGEYVCGPKRKNDKGEFIHIKKTCEERGYHLNKYKPGVIDWVKKCSESAKEGTQIVSLLPSRTDTKWFHRYIWDKSTGQPQEGVKVDFLQGRLKFEGGRDAAPFPSIIVIWG